jgi:hypothetical protein
MVLINQEETIIVIDENIAVFIENDKENNRTIINVRGAGNAIFTMGSYNSVTEANIVLKKFLDAKLRGDKLFKFMQIEIKIDLKNIK